MVTGPVGESTFPFVNIYAPSDGKTRRCFFTELLRANLLDDMPIILCGDFNCVLDPEMDRNGKTIKADDGAPTLRLLVEALGLRDGNSL
jgi:endonuclease/exonuclease/phosphatase family metal-dependent hydrolase